MSKDEGENDRWGADDWAFLVTFFAILALASSLIVASLRA